MYSRLFVILSTVDGGIDVTAPDMADKITEHLDDIFRYALFLTGERNAAGDLMQDTIVRAMDKQHLYREQNSFRSWIFRLMKNTCINASKKAGYEPASWSDLSKDESFRENIIAFNSTQRPVETTSDPILRSRIITALGSIPLKYRDVTYHVDVLGHSYEETSCELDIPVGTVMSRLHRSRAMLRSRLSKEAAELNINGGEKNHA